MIAWPSCSKYVHVDNNGNCITQTVTTHSALAFTTEYNVTTTAATTTTKIFKFVHVDYRGIACDITARRFTQKVSHFGGQVQIWTVTTAFYRAGSVDREGGANDGTVLFCNMLAI